MVETRLEGCTAEPLAGYLKAIGVLRIVAAQADPNVRARWSGDTLALDSSLSLDELVEFFVAGYTPTPIITPWNKGSGFGADDAAKSKSAFEAVASVHASTDPRLKVYRQTIGAAFALAARSGWALLEKADQVSLCRNALPDEAVEWIDAAVVITSSSRTFPPLLGTGGNDGRLDFGSNYMQRVGAVLGLGSKRRSNSDLVSLVRDSLTGSSEGKLDLAAIGQFNPAAAGGPGSSSQGSAESLANPWDFILLFEGAIAFASGVARRFGAASSTSSMPFMVAGVPAAYSSAADENSRGEFWAPIWRVPASAADVLRLLAEGRAEYRGQQARNGVDVARALASLGVDRGIDEFVRYGFLERNGLSTFCVPVGRLKVGRHAGVEVLGDVDRWLAQVRRVSPLPTSSKSLLRAIDGRNFAISQADDPAALQELLYDVSRLVQLVSSSRTLREAVPQLDALKAKDWVRLLDDQSIEFEIAVALASIRRTGERFGWLRELLLDGRAAGRPPQVSGLHQRPLDAVLADCLVQISMRAVASVKDDPGATWCGPVEATWVTTTAFLVFATGQHDERRVARLLAGLLILDWSHCTWRPSTPSGGSLNRVPPELAVLKAVFHHGGLGQLLPAQRPLRAERAAARLLQSGQVEQAVNSALRTIRVAGGRPIMAQAWPASGVAAAHLAAAALIPISDAAARRLINRVAVFGDITNKEEQA